MPTNKYELKSDDLQELMSKVPHLFIIWGNIFVLFFLITGLLTLNSFTIFERKNIAARLLHISKNNQYPDSTVVALATYNTDKININQHIKFKLQGLKNTLNGRILKVLRSDSYESLIYVTVKSPNSDLKIGMIGNAEILIRKTSFISDLANNTFKK